MYKNNDYIYDAALVLEQISGLPVTVESKRKEYDAVVNINGHQFNGIARTEIRKENEGFLINLHCPFEGKPCGFIFIAKYIAADTAKTLQELNINYLESSGNCYIKSDNFFLFISGQKNQRNKQKTNRAKAFQEAGIKLLFHLLSNPENLQLSYRELAELAGISTGSVSNIMAELENQHYILKTKKRRILKNKLELLERWTIAYHDVLRPRLFKKQMRFVKQPSLSELCDSSSEILLGGEPAAAILTNQLIPEQYTIYTNKNWQNLKDEVRLIPDENGKVEVLQQFWENECNDNRIVPPLLIYADLMGSGFGRNIETAKIILENELQHIK
jgi:hypothetical protein